MMEKEPLLRGFRIGTYVMAWMGLLGLTATAVAFVRLRLTDFAMLVAIAIATVKSGMVIFFFMHLKEEPWIVKVMLLIALLALALIILLTFSDILFREGSDAA
jgi:cytochrome c oxidase subunit 4